MSVSRSLKEANHRAWKLLECLQQEPIAENVEKAKLHTSIAIWESDKPQQSVLIYHGEINE